jgi:hypothetical protein
MQTLSKLVVVMVLGATSLAFADGPAKGPVTPPDGTAPKAQILDDTKPATAKAAKGKAQVKASKGSAAILDDSAPKAAEAKAAEAKASAKIIDNSAPVAR